MIQRWKLLLGWCVVIATPACAQRVRPGIDVLLTDSVHLITGQRIGLITNQTGIAMNGASTIDRLWALGGSPSPVPRPRLVALFAPEHGIRGAARPGEVVSDSVDARTGLPIYSLYGANRAPTAEQMRALDLLVVDLQDVGTRTWTYVSTTISAMRAAAAAGKRILVLDRPNPIGCAVQGPVLDLANASFVAMLPAPLRHGLTMGELARFANDTLRIGADLVVVPVQGWRRCDWFDATGLPFVRPSPNLADLEAVAWYPGTVLFEPTNLSVGRGTDAAFRQIGAPWIDPVRLLMVARAIGIPADTVTFTPHSPGDGRYDGVAVRGIRLLPLDRGTGNPPRLALTLLDSVAAVWPAEFRIDQRGLVRLLGVEPEHRDQWPAQRAAFARRIEPFLLYR